MFIATRSTRHGDVNSVPGMAHTAHSLDSTRCSDAITTHAAIYSTLKKNAIYCTYFMNRDSLLDDILGCNEMKDALRQVTTLHRFSLRLQENDVSGYYTQKWWMSEIESWLHRDLHATISVELWLSIGM